MQGRNIGQQFEVGHSFDSPIAQSFGQSFVQSFGSGRVYVLDGRHGQHMRALLFENIYKLSMCACIKFFYCYEPKILKKGVSVKLQVDL